MDQSTAKRADSRTHEDRQRMRSQKIDEACGRKSADRFESDYARIKFLKLQSKDMKSTIKKIDKVRKKRLKKNPKGCEKITSRDIENFRQRCLEHNNSEQIVQTEGLISVPERLSPSSCISRVHSEIEKYKHDAQEAITGAMADLRELLAHAPEGSRGAWSWKDALELLRLSSVGNPITRDEYDCKTYDGPTKDFIICSDEEAIDLFSKGPPALPVLIPKALNRGLIAHRRIKTVLDTLLVSGYISVHRFHAITEGMVPEKMRSEQVVKLFKDPNEGPINCLDLKCGKFNPHPPFIEHNKGYDLMLMAGKHAGRNQPEGFVHPKSSSFSLLSNKGTFSHPHIDRHGVATCIYGDEGSKLWTSWVGLTYLLLEEWIKSESKFPQDRDPISIYLNEGSILFQPAMTLHSPLSKEDVAMTGTMYIHPSGIRNSLQQTILEMTYPEVTNEEPSRQYLIWMRNVIHKLWKDKAGPWDWPPEEEREKCVEYLETLDKLYEGL